MSLVHLMRARAQGVEQNITQVCYGIKLLKNDGDYDLLIGLDKSTSEDGYILLKSGEYIEDWNINPFGITYYKSIGGSVNFRLYSQLLG